MTTWKSARTSPGFTKVSTEGSPCQKDMTPSEKPFLLAITKTLGAPNTGLPGAAAYLQSAGLFTVRGA